MATTFLGLDLPTPSVTLGPAWANDINAAFEVIDQHDHSSGKGVKVPTAGLNINANLDFNSFKAFRLKSTQFSDQLSTLTGSSNAGSLYTTSGNLYYTNTSGIAIQLTSGGSIVSTPAAVTNYETTSIASDLLIAPASTFVFIIVDTTSPRTITLPLAAAVTSGRIYIIKDKDGQSLDNEITLTTQGSDTIDGVSSVTLNSNYGSTTVVGDGSSAWYIS